MPAARLCSAANGTRNMVAAAMAPPLPDSSVTEDGSMLMFKRSQLYVGLGLAAVVELIIKVVAH
jgi:hypothetical protein